VRRAQAVAIARKDAEIDGRPRFVVWADEYGDNGRPDRFHAASLDDLENFYHGCPIVYATEENER